MFPILSLWEIFAQELRIFCCRKDLELNCFKSRLDQHSAILYRD